MARIRTEEQKAAQRAQSKAWRLANPERSKALQKEWRLANPDREKTPKRKAYLAAWQSARYAANPDPAKARAKAWVEAHPEKSQAYQRAYAAANRGTAKARTAAYREANPGRVNACNAKRRATELQATPLWLTPEHHEQIRKWYVLGAAIGYHVDHIVPLKGENVCGLHVPWNLQTLHPIENMSKGNRLLETV